MSDRFRELEYPAAIRKKDVVLMATVSSFEAMLRPSRFDLHQFSELFVPLFEGSSPEAQRQAVAALSQHPHVPPSICFFIGCQPIAIAAPFLMASKAIDDETLIAVARATGPAHLKAIVSRASLSLHLAHVLVEHPIIKEASTETQPAPVNDHENLERLTREEALRDNIRHHVKQLASPQPEPADDRQVETPSVITFNLPLLIKLAQAGEVDNVVYALSRILPASRLLARRIVHDVTGFRLAVTLAHLKAAQPDAVFILEHVHPHLKDMSSTLSRARQLFEKLEPSKCDAHVETWKKADYYTWQLEQKLFELEKAAGKTPVSIKGLSGKIAS